MLFCEVLADGGCDDSRRRVNSHRRQAPAQRLALMALLALLAWGLRARAGGPLEAGLAPDFSLTTFGGETLTLSDLRGQVVIINFWASWCPPCREEAAYLEATWRKYQDRGVVFVGVDYVDAEPNALAYIEEFNILSILDRHAPYRAVWGVDGMTCLVEGTSQAALEGGV